MIFSIFILSPAAGAAAWRRRRAAPGDTIINLKIFYNNILNNFNIYIVACSRRRCLAS